MCAGRELTQLTQFNFSLYTYANSAEVNLPKTLKTRIALAQWLCQKRDGTPGTCVEKVREYWAG